MATTLNSTTFQPTFKRVAQQGRHDDTFAVLAMLTGKTTDVLVKSFRTPRWVFFHSLACCSNAAGDL